MRTHAYYIRYSYIQRNVCSLVQKKYSQVAHGFVLCVGSKLAGRLAGWLPCYALIPTNHYYPVQSRSWMRLNMHSVWIPRGQSTEDCVQCAEDRVWYGLVDWILYLAFVWYFALFTFFIACRSDRRVRQDSSGGEVSTFIDPDAAEYHWVYSVQSNITR